MFVDPGHRGPVQGSSDSVAGLLLARLEKDAVARGWMELLLETGTFLVSARRFYERCGFVECDLFGGYTEAENSVCYRKEL
jgi:putative acetyltransferase